jgi:hypothetical protein
MYALSHVINRENGAMKTGKPIFFGLGLIALVVNGSA